MSEPIQRCITCGRTRECLLHFRADHPPTAAKQWLLRTCPNGRGGAVSQRCHIIYTAGIAWSVRADAPYP